MINKLLELLECYVIAHEDIAKSLEERGTQDEPIYITADLRWGRN